MKHLNILIFYKKSMDFLQPNAGFLQKISCLPKASFLSEGLDDSEAEIGGPKFREEWKLFYS